MNTSKTQVQRTPARRLAAFLLGIFVFNSASAVEFCVNDAATLDAAMVVASLINTSAHTIRMRQGTYALTASTNYTFAAPTTVEGGYTAGCAARVVNPTNTVIDIGLGHAFEWRQLTGTPQALISVDGVTFAHANAGLFIQAGQYGDFSNDPGSVKFTRVRFTNISVGGAATPVWAIAYNNGITLDNVLIDHVTAADSCGFKLRAEGGAFMRLNHVTADLAGGDDLCFDDDNDVDTEIVIFNSILWNSGAGTSTFSGVLSSGTNVLMANNISHGHFFTGATPVIQGQLNAAPGWLGPASGNYHLQTAAPLSIAINNGTTSVTYGGEPASDIEGNPRISGSAPDRGAYESPYNDQSVLTVTNTLDAGVGSLRQAMLDANSSPLIAKSIKFDIRGAGNVPICPAVIALATTLPAIAAPMTIDGYTQLMSIKNTAAESFNANLCVFVKPASGTLSAGFRVPVVAIGDTNEPSLTLRGLGLGGFGQAVIILDGVNHVISGNQFGGNANGVGLPGAGLFAISVGVNVGGSLIVGGLSDADRNVIVGAGTNGINIQSTVISNTANCQIVNNLVGLAQNGTSDIANGVGIHAGGSGCAITRNRITGNTSANLVVAGNGNVIQQNQIGLTTQDIGVFNGAVGVLVLGTNNIIGASGNGGAISANTIRYNVAGGVVIQGDSATGNSVKANLIYDNGFASNGMDIDLASSSATRGITANDVGDGDVGPNQFQNHPLVTSLVYTGPGAVARPATLGGSLDAAPGTYRVDAYYASATNVLGARGHAQVFLGTRNITLVSGAGAFTIDVVVPEQIATGVVSFTATSASGNTSEIGPAFSVVSADLFKDSFE